MGTILSQSQTHTHAYTHTTWNRTICARQCYVWKPANDELRQFENLSSFTSSQFSLWYAAKANGSLHNQHTTYKPITSIPFRTTKTNVVYFFLYRNKLFVRQRWRNLFSFLSISTLQFQSRFCSLFIAYFNEEEKKCNFIVKSRKLGKMYGDI